MIIENAQINGIQTDLAYLDEAMTKLDFVRWQWEYRRATYDFKMEANAGGDAYYLRINTRAVEGKLESPDAILRIEAVYIGKATFPHGLDYDALIPDLVLQEANQKIAGLYQLLKKEQLIEEIMRKEVPRIGPHVSLYEAAQMMKTTQSGILAIIQDDDLVGVITERDLVIRGYAEKQTDSIQVENITSSSLYSVDANYSVAEAIRIMVREKISGVPVVKNGVLVGMVTLDDLAAKNYFA